MNGTLILCGTPIGNLGDTTERLTDALRSATVVYAEDTRRSGKLLRHLGADRPLRSFFVGNEHVRSAELADRLSAGETVALVTDAGMPGISDPGFAAVRAALAVGSVVTVVPGPSAVTAAIAVSGIPAERFAFEGFLPRKASDRAARLAAVAKDDRTLVFFASPNRLASDLVDMAAALGELRMAAVARELTKLHEEVWRGLLGDAAAEFVERKSIKGEVTIVVGPPPRQEADIEAAAALVNSAIDGGASPSQAVRDVAYASGISRKQLYQRVIG